MDAFVGRTGELYRITRVLSGEETANFVHIYGPGGIGKSCLLREVLRRCRDSGYTTPMIFDLSRSDYRDPSRLLNEIATRLGIGYFESFSSELHEYLLSPGEKRRFLTRQLRDSFLSEFRIFSSKTKVTLIFDTLEAVRESEIDRGLLPAIIDSTGIGSLTVIAGREQWQPNLPTQGSKGLSLSLSGFTLDDARLLANRRFEQGGVPLGLPDTAIQRVFFLAACNPLIIDLALTAMLETGKAETILESVGEEFEWKIVEWIRDLADELESRALLQATFLDRRYDAEMMGHLNNREVAVCLQVIEKLQRYPFIKTSETGQTLGLHDQVRSLIKEHLKDTRNWATERWLCEYAVAYYENQLEPSLPLREGQYAKIERIHYQFLLDPQLGFRNYVRVFGQALQQYDIDYCHALLYEVGEHRPKLGELDQHEADLLEGEFYLAEYHPLDALPKFLYLTQIANPDVEPEAVIRAFRGLGECALNECTFDAKALEGALEHCRRAMQLSEGHAGRVSADLRGSLHENIGFAYQLLGMHDLALESYSQALDIFRANKQDSSYADVLDRIGLLYREQYKPREGTKYFEGSLKIRQELSDKRGVGRSYGLLALVTGDQWEIEESERYSAKALEILEEANDPAALATAYGRLAWFKFITRNKAPGNLDDAEKYARKGIAIVEAHGFGRGQSKDYHTLFHVIEIKEGTAAAEPYIRKAYEYARRFSDIFFLFDSLVHIARIDYDKEEFDKLPLHLSEIENYERRGTRISVFKGRILNLLGHVSVGNGELEKAVAYYDQGLRNIVERRTASTVPPLKQEIEDFRSLVLRIPQTNDALATVFERLIGLWKESENPIVRKDLVDLGQSILSASRLPQ
jgi:tetratricopeptide (TPR) repeat protein